MRSLRPRPSLAAGLVVAVAMAGIVLATRHTKAALASPLVPPGEWRTVFVVCALLAIGAWVIAVVLLRHEMPTLRVALAVAVVIQLAPLLSPLLLSRDAFVYWDYAPFAAVHHGNPYTDLPAAYPKDPAYARMGSDWHRTYDAYGPLWTLGGEVETAYTGDSPKRAALAAKVVGALGALFLVGAAAFAARRRAAAVAFLGWCPLVALHLAGGGHNEGWMMGLRSARDRAHAPATAGALGGVAWMAGVGVKWLPLLLVPLELRALPREVARRMLFGLAVAAAAGAACGDGDLRPPLGARRRADLEPAAARELARARARRPASRPRPPRRHGRARGPPSRPATSSCSGTRRTATRGSRSPPGSSACRSPGSPRGMRSGRSHPPPSPTTTRRGASSPSSSPSTSSSTQFRVSCRTLPRSPR